MTEPFMAIPDMIPNPVVANVVYGGRMPFTNVTSVVDAYGVPFSNIFRVALTIDRSHVIAQVYIMDGRPGERPLTLGQTENLVVRIGGGQVFIGKLIAWDIRSELPAVFGLDDGVTITRSFVTEGYIGEQEQVTQTWAPDSYHSSRSPILTWDDEA